MENINTVELFKVVPSHWSIDRSFLVCKKNVSHSSNGKEFIRYEVIERHSAQGYQEPWISTSSLKGVEFTPNECSLIEPYKQ
jgi:hypothetical protein